MARVDQPALTNNADANSRLESKENRDARNEKGPAEIPRGLGRS
jgi:hypothetical protein